MATTRGPRGQRGARPAPRPEIVGTADGRTTDEQARTIRAELERLAGNPDLVGLTTEMVVEAARDPQNPLHDHFTWDVQKAAMKQWLAEARRLIQSVRYVVVSQDTNEPVRVRAVVSAKIVDQRDRMVTHNGWIDRRALLRQRETRTQYIQRARTELRQWVLRHCDVEELTDLRVAVTDALTSG